MDKIDGLTIYSDFITEDEENELVQIINNQKWDNTLKRRTQHYGYKYDYRNRSISKEDYIGSLPEWNDFIIDIMIDNDIVKTKPQQLIVNEYEVGQGISKHIDSLVFDEPIMSLGLNSQCTMNFHNRYTKEVIPIVFDRRDLVVLRSDARYIWMHEICPNRYDNINGNKIPRTKRISLTYRYIK
jgi:alkylated DNA repair dioxygenase AlkB